jgi:negative regulator of sigma E activity
MLKQTLTSILVLTSIMLTSIARAEASDGRWWDKLNQGQKLAYVAGFIDGTGYSVTLLTVATLNAMADPKTGKFNAERAEVAKATSLGTVQALKDNLSNLTAGQVVQGLDATYSDYRNQGISVLDCAYVVIYAIKGGNEAEVTRLLEVRRKQAGK